MHLPDGHGGGGASSPESERLQALRERLIRHFYRLGDVLERTVGQLPAHLTAIAGLIRKHWNYVENVANNIWDLLRRVAESFGDPARLRAMRGEWIPPGTAVAAHATALTRGQSDVVAYWGGRTADRYAFSLPDQRSALVDVQAQLTRKVSEALGGIAFTTSSLYAMLSLAVMQCVGSLLALAIEASTVEGVPLVPITAAGFLAVLAAEVTVVVKAASYQFMREEQKLSEVATETASFGTQWWPVATV